MLGMHSVKFDPNKNYIKMNSGKVTIPTDERVYGELRQRQLESYEQPFWSRLAVVSGNNLSTFFGVVRDGADLAAGNIEGVRLFPEPQLFFAKGMTVDFEGGINVADTNALLNAGVLRLEIAGKERFLQRLIHNPAGGGIAGFTGAAIGHTNGEQNIRNMNVFKHWLRIQTQQTFNLTINFGTPAGVVLTATRNVTVTLWGMWGRQPE